MKRASGLFLHPTSLPSAFGIGDLGEEAYHWIDMLSHMGQSFWQICPLGPTGYGDSPYQGLSSFAGNTLLIAPSILKEMGLLSQQDLDAYPSLRTDLVEYGRVIIEKEKLFKLAFARFNDTPDFTIFCDKQHYWLEDFTLFKVIKESINSGSWASWSTPLKLRYPAELEEIQGAERRGIRYQKFLQYMFDMQWRLLRTYAHQQGVRIIGDLPYYTAYDSSDVWASPEHFELDERGVPLRIAGVPPDFFCPTGQLWGNPIYLWNAMRDDGYSWWIRRIRRNLELVDYIRLNHFRGFDSFWAVPANETTAQKGAWVAGPGIDFFNVLKQELGALPLIAEDLGEQTQRIQHLRTEAQLPGMKVLQFAFDGNPKNPYLPFNSDKRSVVFTGTHDNTTSLGWFSSLTHQQRHRVKEYLNCTDATFHDKLLRLLFGSPSKLCILPLQDVLGLDGSHRMNTPGAPSGNWVWRYTPERAFESHFKRIAELTKLFGREKSADFIL